MKFSPYTLVFFLPAYIQRYGIGTNEAKVGSS